MARIAVYLLVLASFAPPARAARGSEGWSRGAASFQHALREVDQLGTPMAALFVIQGCNACKELEAEVLPTQQVRETLAGFNKVRVDATGDRTLARRYGVEKFPTVLLFARGAYRDKPLRVTGFSDPAAYVAVLARIQSSVNERSEESDGEQQLISASDIYGLTTTEKAKGDLEWAKEMLATGATTDAIELLQRAVRRDPKLIEAAVVLADALTQTGRAKQAIRLLTRALRRAPPDQRGQIYYLRSVAYAAVSNKARAAADRKRAQRAGYTSDQLAQQQAD